MAIIKCEYCKKTFLRIPSAVKIYNFCSHDCKNNFYRQPNDYQVIGNIVYLKLKNNQECLVDIEDFEKIKHIRWFARGGYVQGKFKNKKINLHRYILNCPTNKQVDHINHDKFDNRKANLNLVSNKQNQENRIIGKNNKTGITGVHYRERDKRYIASIRHNRKLINLGSFKNIEDARQARISAEKEYFKYKQAIAQVDWSV